MYVIVIGLIALVFIAAAFADSVGAGVITLFVIAPLMALLYLIYARVLLEVIICLFRIMETNVELVALQRAATGSVTEPPPTTPPPTAPTVHDPPDTPPSTPPPHPV